MVENARLPVTLVILSSSAASPILTVTPLAMFAADNPDTVTPRMVCVPVRYVPDAIVWSELDTSYVVAAFVVTLAVRLTLEFPAVPLEMYPAVLMVGVTDTVLVNVSVFVPVLTVADVPLIEAGAVAVPLATAEIV